MAFRLQCSHHPRDTARLVPGPGLVRLGQHVGVREIIGEQVHVREREGGRVVAEPDLDLLRVQPGAEQGRRAGVAEGVEASPPDARVVDCSDRSGRMVEEMRFRAWLIVGLSGFALVALGGAAASSRSSSSLLPPPAFRSSSAWLSVTTGPTNPRVLAPQVWAITARSNVAALVPFGLFRGLRGLSRNGILISASTSGRGGPTRVWTRARWPLRLSTFRVDRGWEGQPAQNVQQRLRWAWVGGWRLDVRVYFGTQQPAARLVAEAQAELDRLLLPRSR